MGNVAERPADYPYFLVALDYFTSPQVEITLTGSHVDPENIEMLRVIGRHFIPHLVLRHAEEWEEPKALGGKNPAWLCTAGTCRPPVADAPTMGKLLDELLN
jgi:uncharacterized protein YyaL (SSP411 family)